MEFAKVLGCAALCLAVLAGASRGDDYDPSAPRERINASAELSRQKRTLVYTPASTLLLIFGLGTPLQLERESVIVGAFTKLIYKLPGNSSDLTGVHYSARSRWSVYKAIARLASVYGFGDGRSCLLRAICELASSPFDLPNGGLLQQLLQTLFAPSSTREEYDEYSDREYHAAERLGKDERHVDEERCHALYPECRRSFLDVFSATAPRRD